ncbi:UNVERIFIED_ORG: DUF2917 domain-containing protein [Shinella sp. XGS7]|nr:DUF2917 domain-containing protein [Shinella sp. XGS7]
MSLNLSHPAVLDLQSGDLQSLDGLWLTVLEGRVWLTRADDPQDHFLGSGAALRLEPGCQAVLEAQGPARVRLAPLLDPAPAASGVRPAALRISPSVLPGPRPSWVRRLRAGLQAALGPAPVVG